MLEMGDPVKIVDLAEKLIRHHNSDAEIIFTGLRPNEELHEVLHHDGEVPEVRDHPRVSHVLSTGIVEMPWLEDLLALDGSALSQELSSGVARLSGACVAERLR